MYYSVIKNLDIANGEGVRVTLFVSGCRNHCKNCFQPQTWDFNYGQPFTEETTKEILDLLGQEHITGLTLLGGDPFEEENQEELFKLTAKVKEEYPAKNIWAYTGYVLEDILAGKKHTDYTMGLLGNIDVLVDGPFIQEEHSKMLRFKGSANQRLIKNPALEIREVIG